MPYVCTMDSHRLDVAACVVDGGIVPGDVEIADGRIAAVGCEPAGAEGLAAPGLVDVHVHGCAGVDFLTADEDGYHVAGERLLAAGVTACQPAFVCAPEEQLTAALAVLGGIQGSGGPRFLGAHLEGPFLSADKLGTHTPAYRRDPDVALLERLIAAGPVSEVTLAPELPGALDLVDLLVHQRLIASVGHTNATAAQAAAAFDRGARSVTHLFNAMRTLHHREPGTAGVALARGDVAIELIVDGHHLHPDVVRTVWRAAVGRIVLVTDGTAASGMPDGTYRMGDIDLTVTHGAVRNPDGALAGSALMLIDAVRNVHALGVPLEEAISAATEVPARLLRRDHLGQLRIGAIADLVVLDDDLGVRATYVDGRRVFST